MVTVISYTCGAICECGYRKLQGP